MNYYKLTLIALITLTAISCGTEPEPLELKGIWQNEGLENFEINALDYSKKYFLAAGNEQMLRKQMEGSADQWMNLQLEINTENSIFGDVLFTGEEIYAVVRNFTEFHSLPDDYISLYKSMNEGDSWEPIQITLQGREKPYVINRLEFNENALYADWHLIFKSTDGKNWLNLSEGEKVGVSEFLYVSKEHPNQIWTGGWTHIFSPYLAKSTDGGETWTNLNENIYFSSDATVYAASIHPEQEQTVLAGLGGSVGPANVIRKSVNGGESWETVLDGYNIRVLKNSEKKVNHVYASGISQSGRLFVAVSNNYGNSWDIMEYEGGPVGVETNDMIVAEVEGNETLFFATNKGVYSLTFEE